MIRGQILLKGSAKKELTKLLNKGFLLLIQVGRVPGSDKFSHALATS